jgi:SHS2 domain-containing protein
MSKTYEFIEHTADVEFRAFGRNIETCFSNALVAMLDTISYTRKLSSSKSKNIKFIIKDTAKSLDDLLWYILQDTLSVADSRDLFAYKINSLKISERNGKYKIDLSINSKQKTVSMSKLDVKGVSRYNLSVVKNRNGWIANVVLDV